MTTGGALTLNAVFSLDGELIVTSSDDRTSWLRPCVVCEQPEATSAAIKRRVERQLTDEERQFSGLPPRGTEQQPGR